MKLRHKNLDVWQKSIKLTSDVYGLTNDFPKYELYGLTSQLRRAAVSVSSNIAEGAARSSSKERRRFYEISRSSLVEIDTQLEIPKCLNYIEGGNLIELEETLNHAFAMLSNLISSIR